MIIAKTIAIYIFIDDILKSIDYKKPANRKTTDAKITTSILIDARYFRGNIESSIGFVRNSGLMPEMLGKSRFKRRMHKIGRIHLINYAIYKWQLKLIKTIFLPLFTLSDQFYN